jgi:hypothetical protein
VSITELADYLTGLFVITPATAAEVLTTEDVTGYLSQLKSLLDDDSLYLGVGLVFAPA